MKVRNELSGNVAGPVVQAGTIGHLVVYPQPLRAVAPVPRQLPAAVPDFSGRARELAALDKLLPSTEASLRRSLGFGFAPR